ncbi:sugar phosphate isomerase/epimerase family protein [Hydrotalea sp.]|uniref:sugar phosphate isomerase/epimerase family protein n=1 Tax=Hydrotalea sp. TaxID=2881279 RepID=UPI003D0A1590
MKKKIKNTFPVSLVFLIIFNISCNTNLSHNNDSINTPPWNLGIQLWTFHLFPFITAIEKADSCKLVNLEAYSGQPIGGVYRDSFNINMSETSKSFVKAFLKNKKMKLIGFGVLNPTDKNEWKKVFVFAKELGIQILTAEPRKQDLDYADSLAGIYGIKIAIHNHPKPAQYWHPDSVLAASIHHPNIFACADIGHWARSGLDPLKCIQLLKGKIADIHLKDVDAFNKIDANNMILGDGIINLKAIFSELKNQSYSGQISIEHEQNWMNNVPDIRLNINWYNQEMLTLFKPNKL